ncbi:thioredoxin-like protein [Clavulina sp. PMI_390]|nr:thioredoxin-like protein [Clavulina sp. PMI_390]
MYFDISSPWSNIIYHVLQRYEDSGTWDMEWELVPIFLGGIMVATKNTPPSALQAPLYYVKWDTERVAKQVGVDTRSPPGHPLNTTSLNQIRLLRVIKSEEGNEVLKKCVGLVFHEFYAIQTLYTSPEFWDCLVPVLGREKLNRYLKLAQSDENKEGVKADVLKAIKEAGMYGAPWFLATRADGRQERYFGYDCLERMAWFLGPEYPYRGPYPSGDNARPLNQLNRDARL